jgi:hypothetical protein
VLFPEEDCNLFQSSQFWKLVCLVLPGLFNFIQSHGENSNKSLYYDSPQQVESFFAVVFSSTVTQQLDSFALTELAP